MTVKCEIYEPANISVKVTTIMTLSGWRTICGALAEDDSAAPQILMGEIKKDLRGFEHVVVRGAVEPGEDAEG